MRNVYWVRPFCNPCFVSIASQIICKWRCPSKAKPPVISKTIGSYPTFMASHRFPQSFKSNLRLAYEFAAESSTLAEVAKFVARNGDTIAKSNANRGNCRQEDATIEGVVIIKTSAGRSCGSDGNNPISSKLGRAPANSAYRYTVLRNVLCINCLCPDAIHVS